MFKKLLALLMVLALCLSMFACGGKKDSSGGKKSDKDDEEKSSQSLKKGDSLLSSVGGVGKTADQVINTVKENEVVQFVADEDMKAFRISVGAENIAKLIAENGGEIPFEIGNIQADLYFDFENFEFLQQAETKVNGKKVSAYAYEDAEDIIVSTSLLKKSYGMKTETVVAILEQSMQMAGNMLSSAMSDVFEMDNLEDVLEIADVMIELAEEYSGYTLDLMLKYMNVEEEDDGDNTVHTFTFTQTELGLVMSDLANKIAKDKEIDKIAAMFGIDMNTITESMKMAAEDIEFLIEGNYVTPKGEDTVLSFMAEMSAGYETVTAEYSYDPESGDFALLFVPEQNNSMVVNGNVDDDGNFECSIGMQTNGKEVAAMDIKLDGTSLEYVAYENGREVAAMAFKFGDGEYSMRAFENGNEIYSMVLAYANNKYEFTVSQMGNVMVYADGKYKQSGNTFRLELGAINAEGTSIDLAPYGIYFEIEKNAKLPNVSKNYTEVSLNDYSLFEQIGNELQTSLMNILQ